LSFTFKINGNNEYRVAQKNNLILASPEKMAKVSTGWHRKNNLI
jgi:hypothetical protein